MAKKHLATIADTVDFCESDKEPLYLTAMTTLSSKIVNKHKRKMAEIAVDAVFAVADLKRKDVNFDMIKVVCKPGGKLEDTRLIHGIILDKDFSHPQVSFVQRSRQNILLKSSQYPFLTLTCAPKDAKGSEGC